MPRRPPTSLQKKGQTLEQPPSPGALGRHGGASLAREVMGFKSIILQNNELDAELAAIAILRALTTLNNGLFIYQVEGAPGITPHEQQTYIVVAHDSNPTTGPGIRIDAIADGGNTGKQIWLVPQMSTVDTPDAGGVGFSRLGVGDDAWRPATDDSVTLGESAARWKTLYLSGQIIGGSQQTQTVTGVISPAQITGDQNNYNPTGLATASILRLNSDAARSITGLMAQTAGRVITIVNVGAFDITLENEHASSDAANRFLSSADIVLGAEEGMTFFYDDTSDRWRPMARI